MGAPYSAPSVPDALTAVDSVRPLATPRLGAAIPLLVAVCTAAVAIWAIEPRPVGVFQDDGLYAILAKSIANGEGLRFLNLPDSPAATHYPPGYPFFLSLLWRLSPSFPDNIVLFKFANAVWLALAALGAAMFSRRRLEWETVPSTLAG